MDKLVFICVYEQLIDWLVKFDYYDSVCDYVYECVSLEVECLEWCIEML